MLRVLLAAALAYFPAIHARTLDGHEIDTARVYGQPIAYMIGFSDASRGEVEPWARALSARAKGLKLVEMPVSAGPNAPRSPRPPWRPVAAGVEVWTTAERDALAAGLGLADAERAAAIVLVDDRDRVRLVLRGGPTPEAERAFLGAYQGLAAED
jgi:hypothetical protein